MGVDLIDAKVTETYKYLGKGGRVSRRDTDIAPLGYAFNQKWTYDDLGNVVSLGYPRCEHTNCVQSLPSSSRAPVRDQAFTYSNGWLTQVPGFASAIRYHDSGMVSEVVHTNGGKETISADPWDMARPRAFTYQARKTNGATLTWGGRALTYDGAGNMVQGAFSTYAYDHHSRVVKSEFDPSRKQVYFYDNFGNLKQTSDTTPAGTQVRAVAIETKKNRISASALVQYDRRGNLLHYGDDIYAWDELDQLTTKDFPQHTYVYTADDERIWTIQIQPGQPSKERLTLRGLDPCFFRKVLRTWEITGGNNPAGWSWKKTTSTAEVPTSPPR